MIDGYRPDAEPKKEQINYTVRVATPEDGARIADIHYASWLATYPSEEAGISLEMVNAFQVSPEAKRERWTRVFLELGKKFREQIMVVSDGDRIVGFCRVMKEEGRGFVHSLFLDPEYQGRGAGAAVFQAGLDWLDKDLPIELEVASHTQTAKSFYRKFGFDDVGPARDFPLRDGAVMKTDLMRRPAEKEAGE